MAPLTDAEMTAIQRKLEDMIEEIEDHLVQLGPVIAGVEVARNIISRATGVELRLRVSVDAVQPAAAP